MFYKLLAGRITADILSLPLGIAEIGLGAGNIGAGVVECGTGVLCFAGGAQIVVGGAIVLEGSGTAVKGAIGLGENIYLMSSKGRPGNNQAQNKQFDGAVRELEKFLERKLSKDEIRLLHESLHSLEDPGYWDIVEEGRRLFER